MAQNGSRSVYRDIDAIGTEASEEEDDDEVFR
jgi:hypothetical protein